MTGILAALPLAGAVGLGLSASALHARAHRRREAGLASGTVYPLLDRLGELGWVASRWESDDDPPRATGPRRRFWRLTDDGRNHAAAVLASTEKRPVLESLNGDRT